MAQCGERDHRRKGGHEVAPRGWDTHESVRWKQVVCLCDHTVSVLAHLTGKYIF